MPTIQSSSTRRDITPTPVPTVPVATSAVGTEGPATGTAGAAAPPQPVRDPVVPAAPPPRKGFSDLSTFEVGVVRAAAAAARAPVLPLAVAPVPLPAAPAAAPAAPAAAPAAPAAAPAVAPLAPPAAAVAAPPAPHGHAPSGAVRLSPNDLGVLAQDQGNTNACGTTSLANVMTHWGQPRTHQQIDRSIRAFDSFSAPDRLRDYARSNGMRSETAANASLGDLTRMIDHGAPPIVLIDPDEGNNAILHYVTVTGYNRNARGEVSDLVIANSAGGERHTMPAEEFRQRWGNLRMHNIATGMNNVMITAVPNDTRRVVGGDGVARSAASILLPTTTVVGMIRSGPARAAAAVISDAAVVTRAAGDGAQTLAGHVQRGGGMLGGMIHRVWRSIFN